MKVYTDPRRIGAQHVRHGDEIAVFNRTYVPVRALLPGESPSPLLVGTPVELAPGLADGTLIWVTVTEISNERTHRVAVTTTGRFVVLDGPDWDDVIVREAVDVEPWQTDDDDYDADDADDDADDDDRPDGAHVAYIDSITGAPVDVVDAHAATIPGWAVAA